MPRKRELNSKRYVGTTTSRNPDSARSLLMYSVEADYVYVLAVAHQHRAQNYWHDRIPGA